MNRKKIFGWDWYLGPSEQELAKAASLIAQMSEENIGPFELGGENTEGGEDHEPAWRGR